MAKRYLSIIRLFRHCGIEVQEGLNASRARKLVVAEFNHSADGFIETGGFTYNKEDALDEIQHPEFERRMAYHLKLWEHPHLLNVLEKDELNITEVRREIRDFEGDDYFDQLFSPFFAEPFNNLTRNLIQQNRLADLGVWFELEPFLQPSDRDIALKTARIFLEEQTRLIKNVTADNFKVMREQVEVWFSTDWYQFLNSLPEEFHDMRNVLCANLINLSVALQKKYRQHAIWISDNLTKVLHLPDSMSTLIHNNHSAFQGGSSSSGDSGTSYTWIIWVIIILLKLMVASRGCS